MTQVKHNVKSEIIIENLRSLIEKMLDEAPVWGDVNIKLIFNNNILKRIETAISTSIQITDDK